MKILERFLDSIAARIAQDVKKKIVNAALDEAIASCDYWVAQVRKDNGPPSDYGKINLLGLVKMDLQHLKKHGYRYYPVGDNRPRDMSFWS